MANEQDNPLLPHVTAASDSGRINVELAARRTGMSFQRTRMSADRTLMSVIRTSLSLISFGFTIFQVFQKLRQESLLTGAAPARNFGIALVILGLGMLTFGIVYHLQFMYELRKTRNELAQDGLIHAKSRFPVSLTLLVALALFLLGLFAIASMVFHIGPFN